MYIFTIIRLWVSKWKDWLCIGNLPKSFFLTLEIVIF